MNSHKWKGRIGHCSKEAPVRPITGLHMLQNGLFKKAVFVIPYQWDHQPASMLTAQQKTQRYMRIQLMDILSRGSFQQAAASSSILKNQHCK